jgi:hypothetical protein
MFYTEFKFNDYEQFLMEELEGQKAQRAEFIKKNYLKNEWPKDGYLGFEKADDFIEKVGEVDPSRNGMYMPWLAKMIIGSPTENRIEDLDRAGEDLRHFEQFKRQIERKDINQYKSFQDLYDVIAPFLVPREMTQDEKEKAKQQGQLEKVKKDIITVYNGPEGWIRIPTTRDAAIFLGQNTRWCTSARGNNMFAHYAKSDSLFVVYDKETKARSQLHIDSGQFAGEDDRNKGLKAVPKWAQQPIVDWYKANNPNMSIRHIMALTNYSDENLAAGTKHEDLINLMKKYNV